MFGNPTSARTAPSSEAALTSTREDIERRDVPRAVSRQLHQQQQQQGEAGAGSASSTPYGALSPGRRRYVRCRMSVIIHIDGHT